LFQPTLGLAPDTFPRPPSLATWHITAMFIVETAGAIMVVASAVTASVRIITAARNINAIAIMATKGTVVNCKKVNTSYKVSDKIRTFTSIDTELAK